MACEKSTDLPSGDLVTQQTVPLDQDTLRQEHHNSSSGISSLIEGEHKDVKDCSTSKKKRRRKRKKKRESTTHMQDDSETVTEEKMCEIGPDSDYLDQTCKPDWNEKNQEKHQCPSPESMDSLVREGDDLEESITTTKMMTELTYSQSTMTEGIGLELGTDCEQRPVDLKQAILPDGDNANTALEHVVTEEGIGSQATTTNELCFGEKDHFGLAGKKRKTKKKKKKKTKKMEEQENNDGDAEGGNDADVESRSERGNKLYKFQHTPEPVAKDVISSTLSAAKKADKTCSSQILQNSQDSVQGTTDCVHGVATFTKDEHRTQVDQGRATVPDEETSKGTEDTLTVSQFQKDRETVTVSVEESKAQREKELGDANTVPCGSGETEQHANEISSAVAEAKKECCKGSVQEVAEGAHGVTTSEQDESKTGDDHVSTSMPSQEELCHVAKDNSSTTTCHEERNILCIFKLVYGVGLRALRNLFMEIHPSWSNLPTDAAGLDKGGMKLRREEECSFNTGNIDEWDFSLMTSVLLFSKRCALEIAKRPHHDAALRDLKSYRNRLLGHPSNDKMSDLDFNSFWPHLSSNFVTLGASPDEIAEIKVQSDELLHSGDYYRNLFLKEQEKELRCEKKIDAMGAEMNSKLDAILAHQRGSDVAKAPLSPKSLSGAKWDEWLKFRDAVGDFQANHTQYILVADAMSPEDLECFSRLRSVPWKMILDFDPMSEEKGFYREFTSAEGQSNLVSMFTPPELERSSMGNLVRQIDPNKIQWLFVNGRFSDTDGSSHTFPDWEANSVKHISRFLACCSDPDKFDKQKRVICLILPFCKQNVPHLEVTLSRLLENFNDFDLRFVSFKHQHCHRVPRKCMVRNFDLSPSLVNLGLKEMLCTPTTQEYRMPTSHAGVPAKLRQNEYLYLKEHLQILYDGCEDLPEPLDDPAEADKQLKDFFEEHRRSFISGNQISFVSLYDNHDAKREIESQIRTHIQRVLDQGLTRSLIVEIRHSPGTGGTTIARRVMWDLSKAYPCAFVEVTSPHYFDEDNIIAGQLVNRILAMEEICHTTPVILIDGKQSGIIEGFSNKLVRMLCNTGKRALLLRCLHGTKPSKTQESSHVHHVFSVNVKLEDSISDLREFQSKYKEYLEQSSGKKPSSDLCRVFHFPLLAMMEEFRPKLRKIIDDTLSEMGGLQQEIAVIVAFLQKYANHATPALLLYEAFKDFVRVAEEKCPSYEDIARQLFTEHLLNLMVPTNPLRRRGRSDPLREPPPESYTLQHHSVADLVLRKVFREQNRDLFDVVRKFLQFPIYQHECFLSLFQELFAYNKYGLKLKFSILFEELKRINSEHAAEVFCEAAEKTNDPVIFTNAARFLAKKDPPSFSQAKELIHRAFHSPTHSRCHFKVRTRVLCHSKGVVLFSELKHMIHSGEVKDLEKLEGLATNVLEAYHEARNVPPTYPHPLIGEVEVWLTCIEWIMKNICRRDSDETLKFLTKQSPPFFRTCVSHSFHLLDIVDGIVQSVPNLTDPEETQRRCNNARLSLMSIFRRRYSQTGRRRDSEDLVQACKALCTAKNFPKSSQLELKKLQAHFILSSGVQIDALEQENLSYLLRLLEELVLMENEYRFAYHLMKVCVLVTGPRCYTLEQGLNISEKWLEVSHYDCLPYFYQMAIYFLKILDGYTVEFMPHYKKALKACRDKSQNNLRSTQSTLFVGKEGRGMSRLTTRNTLFLGETDYSTDDSEKVNNFWLVDSRKKLLECKGRIRMGQSSGRGKSHPYIELLQGNVELYVGKNSDIGKVERDFTPGTLAYFVVSFNLQGPVANGISLSPQHPSHQ